MPAFLGLRAALILLGAVVVGAITFVLAYHASPTHSGAAAALMAGGATGAAVVIFDQIFGGA